MELRTFHTVTTVKVDMDAMKLCFVSSGGTTDGIYIYSLTLSEVCREEKVAVFCVTNLKKPSDIMPSLLDLLVSTYREG